MKLDIGINQTAHGNLISRFEYWLANELTEKGLSVDEQDFLRFVAGEVEYVPIDCWHIDTIHEFEKFLSSYLEG
jgi:hypothetical protein